ncbi:hypothetical protein WICPIJ_009997 [Wickerhamomyces pijperi]|uniref:Uncharacterized protein n=1 Tax=Wickerhamomyces pijperi TaxID=599730 RepID=A0A9P8TBD3_WICPI|nr:hypothetical protein WICPIJ_009997 [Wickerhamomyces pijperi]
MSFVQTFTRIARQPTLRSTLTMSSRSLATITPVATKNAPPAAASYSQAIKANNFVYVSGQVPFTPEGKAVTGSISEQAEQVFSNLKAILEEAGSGLDRAVKVNVFLTDINDFAEFNVVYAKYFNVHKPARSCVAVKALPLGAALEVEAIALEN